MGRHDQFFGGSELGVLALPGVVLLGLVVSGEVLLGAVLDGGVELGAVSLGELAGGIVSISELLLRVVSRLQPVKLSAAAARAEAERRAMRVDFMGHLFFRRLRASLQAKPCGMSLSEAPPHNGDAAR